MDGLIQATQLILSLSILVILHELGHFIPAKLFNTRVEKFYLFFDPWFSLFKFKRGETEYGIGWLPLGGYVKISGMIDESMDKEQMKLPPQPWEFRSKPAWQRLIIMLGGVTMNMILGVLIYAMILFSWGEEYLPTENVVYGIHCDSMALSLGLQNGDKIISVDNNKVENFLKIPIEIILNNAKTIQIEREGQMKELSIAPESIGQLLKSRITIMPRMPFIAQEFTEGSVAKEAGIKVGDKLVGINDISVQFFDEFKEELGKYKNQEVVIHVRRDNNPMDISLKVPETGLIGIYPNGDLSQFFELKEKQYSFLASFPAGVHKTYEMFDNYIQQMKLLFTVDNAYESLGGFITIGKAFSPEWDWVRFWNFTAFLSIILAVMNILPIPALDGGHVVFVLYEIITRRKPNEKVLEYAQIAGFVILITLLVVANGQDIMRWLK